MQSILIWSKSNRKHLWLNRGIHLMFLLAVLGAMLGYSGGGGGGGGEHDGCVGPSVNNFMNAQVAEIIQGLTFTFTDGEVFDGGLAGETVTITVDTFTDPDLTITLATANSMATGETFLVPCDLSSEPKCLFDVTVTTSDFPASEGPQLDDVLVFRDWFLHAHVDNCTNRTIAIMRVEDSTGTGVPSEPLDLPKQELCPMLCPSA